MISSESSKYEDMKTVTSAIQAPEVFRVKSAKIRMRPEDWYGVGRGATLPLAAARRGAEGSQRILMFTFCAYPVYYVSTYTSDSSYLSMNSSIWLSA